MSLKDYDYPKQNIIFAAPGPMPSSFGSCLLQMLLHAAATAFLLLLLFFAWVAVRSVQLLRKDLKKPRNTRPTISDYLSTQTITGEASDLFHKLCGRDTARASKPSESRDMPQRTAELPTAGISPPSSFMPVRTQAGRDRAARSHQSSKPAAKPAASKVSLPTKADSTVDPPKKGPFSFGSSSWGTVNTPESTCETSPDDNRMFGATILPPARPQPSTDKMVRPLGGQQDPSGGKQECLKEEEKDLFPWDDLTITIDPNPVWY